MSVRPGDENFESGPHFARLELDRSVLVAVNRDPLDVGCLLGNGGGAEVAVGFCVHLIILSSPVGEGSGEFVITVVMSMGS